MLLDIRARGVEVQEVTREHIKERLESGLERFGNRISRVQVFLEDMNGPRGGVDKLCRIEARLAHSNPVFVEDSDSSLLSLIDRTTSRLIQAIERAVDRHVEHLED